MFHKVLCQILKMKICKYVLVFTQIYKAYLAKKEKKKKNRLKHVQSDFICSKVLQQKLKQIGTVAPISVKTLKKKKKKNEERVGGNITQTVKNSTFGSYIPFLYG